MDTAGYVALSRQSGLWKEMSTVANNIANSTTTGFKREGVIFSEYLTKIAPQQSLSTAHGNVRWMDQRQGSLSLTNGELDFAIQGDGFFQVETENGPMLTRAGNFHLSDEGTLISADGHALLDEGGAPIFVPQNGKLSVAQDGSLSIDGENIGRLALWQPEDPLAMTHQAGTLFNSAENVPVENIKVLQGFLEESNVNPLLEMARMIEVQRGYEMAQKFLETEDSRTRNVIQTLGKL